MRTTIVIDGDVLSAAKRLAKREKNTVGKTISNLARLGLARTATFAKSERNGIPLIRGQHIVSPVTLEIVNRLRDGHC